MMSKRPTILMAILLALIGYFGYFEVYQRHYAHLLFAPELKKPLPGENRISGISVARVPEGRWMLTFDYYYTGQPDRVTLQLEQQVSTGAGQPLKSFPVTFHAAVKRGQQHVTVELTRPYEEAYRLTQKMAVQFKSAGAVVTSATADTAIEWPDFATMAIEKELASSTPEAIVARAVRLIDQGSRSSLREAKQVLERLVEKYPRLDSAYVELARVAMKTNWGPEGWRQAEALIGSALQIRPDSVNANILLGYVYAYQRRYKEAEKLFVEAAQQNPPNLWLWTNWGELFALQGQRELAIAKFRETLSHPPPGNTYDRAREHAYRLLLPMLEERKDFDGMEALYKQRAQEYAATGCYRVEYGRFVLTHRGDFAVAADLAQAVPESQCGQARELLGLARYFAWAVAKEPERSDLLRQARVAFPVGPGLFYQLARADRTASVAQQLIAAAEKVDAQDNAQLNALAYALREQDTEAARRLLRLGARADALVGSEQMPVALIPVLTRDFDSIRVMQRAGVDYAKLRFQGSTAVEHARSTGDAQLQRALEPKSSSPKSV